METPTQDLSIKRGSGGARPRRVPASRQWGSALAFLLPAALTLAGLALVWHLVARAGPAPILHAAAALGWPGFALVLAVQSLLLVPMATAWWLLARGRPDARLPRFLWARLVRDSAGEVLPFSQLGGYAAGARALAVAGVSGPFAAASTVVDVSTELAGQLGYTLLGLALLWWRLPHSPLLAPVLLATLAMAALVAAFVAVQARGAGAADRLLTRASTHLLGGRAGDPPALSDAIRAMHARPATLLAAATLHFAEWVLSGVQAWATLRLMGLHPGLAGGLVIDSLLYGARSFAFLVPNAIGVQEATLVLVGGLFGIPPDAALALSLVRRARDLALAAPALCAWQFLEARRALKGRKQG